MAIPPGVATLPASLLISFLYGKMSPIPMVDPPPVSTILTQLGVKHELFVHEGPLSSLQQAAEERGQRPQQVIRSLVFRLGKGDYVMVLVAGPDQISWPALRQYLNKSRITTANRGELLSLTGYEPGAVAPFGLRYPMRILVDRSVLAEEVVSLGSGIRGTAIIMKSAVMLDAIDQYETIDLGVGT